MAKTIYIDPLSGTSLYLQQVRDTEVLGTATGFITKINNTDCLITNWHVVSGRNPSTNQPSRPDGKTPNKLNILHHASAKLGTWVNKIEELFEADGTKRWLEHTNGRNIDVVILPLSNKGNDISINHFDLNLKNTDMIATPAMPVSIIGYPLGIATGGVFPIWKTGHIASDPDLNYGNLPVFLIDATTRGGMSGSPVILRLSGNYKTRNGNTILAGGQSTLFMGVYSGRTHNDSELGLVWRPEIIDEIISSNNIT